MTALRAALLTGALVTTALAGCSSQTSSDPSAPNSAGASEARDHAGAMGTAAQVDAGFAYDMSRHHAQAVELSEIVSARTVDPAVLRLARDVALTQQYQIGQMRGWLDAWGLPATTTDEPMAWMGMRGPMPGLASAEELEALRSLSGDAADQMYLELLIRHHRGGVEMASVAAEEASSPYVRALAASMVVAQSAEVKTMQAMLIPDG